MAPGYRAGFAAVGHLELGEDVCHVDARRFLGDEQGLGDPPVGEALGQEFEYLAFARGEVGRRPGRSWFARASWFAAGHGFEIDQGPGAQLADLPREGPGAQRAGRGQGRP